MTKLFLLITAILMSQSVYAEFTEREIRTVLTNVINETISESKLENDYQVALRKYLNNILLDKQMVDTVLLLANESKKKQCRSRRAWIQANGINKREINFKTVKK